MGYYCNNDREHQEDARRDFDRRGAYGYDTEYYDHYTSDGCKQAYTEEFDQSVREERMMQQMHEEEREREEMEMRQEQARMQRNQEEVEEDYYYQQMQYDQACSEEQKQPQNGDTDDELPF